MNCKHCQEKILETFAAGGQFLDSELARHRDSCPDCSAFFVKQRNFFESLDAQLHSMANEPVPLSFLSGLRARLDAPASIALPHLGVALVTISAVLVLLLGFAAHRSADHSTPSALISTAAMSAPPSASGTPTVQKTLPSPPVTRSKSIGTTKLRMSPSGVIVRPEERRAFAQLVAELPANRNMALALANPAPARAEDSLEISLLQMGSVEVKPLGAKVRE
jgi:hypothetical protein